MIKEPIIDIIIYHSCWHWYVLYFWIEEADCKSDATSG